MTNDMPDFRDTQEDFRQAATSSAGSFNLEPADYLADMEGFDLTEAQKVELLETLWSILRSIVEMGVEVGDVDPCGQLFGSFSAFPGDQPDSVESSASTGMEMSSAAGGEEGAA